MTITKIHLFIYISLVIGFAIGAALLFWRAKGLYRQDISVQSTGDPIPMNEIFVRMAPALIGFFACCAPAIYFNHLIKQHDYCIEIVRVNKIQSAQDEFLQERCAQNALPFPPRVVTVLQLILNPEKYDGAPVVVTGYCRLNFEGTAIYAYQEDFTKKLGNQIWLEASENLLTEPNKRVDYCLVEGQYFYNKKGHMGLYIGAIEKITRYERWPPK